MKTALVAGILTAFPAIASAATTGEEDTIVINPINATDFAVIEDMNSGPGYFWCGAATYIERRQGRSELTQLYIKRPRGAAVTVPGGTGVVFSTSSAGLPAAPEVRLSITVDQPGVTLKSVKARRYCRDAFTRATK